MSVSGRHGRVNHDRASLACAALDAVHLREEGLIRLPDPDIVAKAAQEQRVVLTFDLDFGDIIATAGSEGPSVAIFRLRNQTPAGVNPRLFRVIAECAEELASGAIVIVEDERFRVRRLPKRPCLRALRKRRLRFELRETDLSFPIRVAHRPFRLAGTFRANRHV